MVQARRRLILFARIPVAGKVKTRLIPALGAEQAAALYRRLLLRTLRAASAFCRADNVELEIHFAGEAEHSLRHWLGDSWIFRPQSSGDLGQRMASAFDEAHREGSQATVLIGTDCPSLTPQILRSAFQALTTNGAVFGPALDGGYYLVGLTHPRPELFQGVRWGSETVLADSTAILGRQAIEPTLLRPLGDLDRPEDLLGWQRTIEEEEKDLGQVSIIIPTLNESTSIAETLQSADAGSPREIIVADGGSADDTCPIARSMGATVVPCRPGRSRQMNAGASLASGSALLFLHADTLLPKDWARVVEETLGQLGVVAGSFELRIKDAFVGRRLVERGANLRSRWFQEPYGDQALFLKRSLFEELGGFADLPIMEDAELNRRLRRRGRLVTSSAIAKTSGRRWRRLGVIRTTFINQIMVAGFHLGVCPRRLSELYRKLPPSS